MPEIKFIPNSSAPYWNSASDKKKYFGCFQRKNNRTYQEDALVWLPLTPDELAPNDTTQTLSPSQIGYRLWTSYHLLDYALKQKQTVPGSTASTTVYDGQGNIITATLGDTVFFAIIYDKENKVLGLSRLNKVTHKPDNEQEIKRITEAKGIISMVDGVPRVNNILALTRALGDNMGALRDNNAVCSDAHIDCTSIDALLAKHQINRSEMDRIMLISASDGFTDGAGAYAQTKEGHEQYLTQLLQQESVQKNCLNEKMFAWYLINAAIADGSQDNITLGVQRITAETAPMFLGVYDGHGGIETSAYVANHIVDVFKRQCALNLKQYAEQEWSVHKNPHRFLRDHTDADLMGVIQDDQDKLEEAASMLINLRDNESDSNVRKAPKILASQSPHTLFQPDSLVESKTTGPSGMSLS